MSDDLADLLRVFLARLAALGTPYMIVGSVAALAHGRTRATQDIDVVVDADERALKALVAALPSERFYVDEQAAVDAHRRSTLFNIIDMDTGWKLDVIPLKRRPFSQREFTRRMPLTVLGVDVFVASIEDTIVAKLEWSNLAGGSERHLDDVRELVRLAGARLDRAYVEAAVDELGLRDAWSNAVEPG
jgi:hypothetical protein